MRADLIQELKTFYNLKRGSGRVSGRADADFNHQPSQVKRTLKVLIIQLRKRLDLTHNHLKLKKTTIKRSEKNCAMGGI